MVTIQFSQPRNAHPGDGYDGILLAFRFEVIKPGVGAHLDETTEHKIFVAMSGHHALTWGLDRYMEDPLSCAKVLFQEVKKEVLRLLVEDELGARPKVDLDLVHEPKLNPYNLTKLEEPTGAKYQIDLDATRAHRKIQKGSNPIGFQFPPSADA